MIEPSYNAGVAWHTKISWKGELKALVGVLLLFVTIAWLALKSRAHEDNLKQTMSPEAYAERQAEQWAEGKAAGRDNRD